MPSYFLFHILLRVPTVSSQWCLLSGPTCWTQRLCLFFNWNGRSHTWHHTGAGSYLGNDPHLGLSGFLRLESGFVFWAEHHRNVSWAFCALLRGSSPNPTGCTCLLCLLHQLSSRFAHGGPLGGWRHLCPACPCCLPHPRASGLWEAPVVKAARRVRFSRESAWVGLGFCSGNMKLKKSVPIPGEFIVYCPIFQPIPKAGEQRGEALVQYVVRRCLPAPLPGLLRPLPEFKLNAVIPVLASLMSLGFAQCCQKK